MEKVMYNYRKIAFGRIYMSECVLCPRMCRADREGDGKGFCGESSEMRISRIALHPFEEPPVSGRHGSGTVFFCGCSLRCVFCQNRDISRGESRGRIYSPEKLADEMLALRDAGAANINLVTPTHFADRVAEALRLVKNGLDIPVVYNTSGYERAETLKTLDGLVDIYMPDLKYASSELADKYSSAPDYPTVALSAITEMYSQVGKYAYAADGTLSRGLLVRHLVLPGNRKDSIAALEALANAVPPEDILVSIMSQYTPDFAFDSPFPELHRRLTSFEYDSVVRAAERLGFEGFTQSRLSAVKEYTPEFK